MYKCSDIIPKGCERTFQSEVSLNSHLLGEHFIFRPLCGTGINEKKHATKIELEILIKEQVSRLKKTSYKGDADIIANILNNLLKKWHEEKFIMPRTILIDSWAYDYLYMWYPHLMRVIMKL